ncbi:MAG: Bug family tripartite tricarboxylate transporter substrate binding protein [Xanthobacteraceae bacterium]
MRAFAQTLITAALLSTPGGESRAQTPADFFKGRTVDLYIGYSVGGGYDVYARMVARHMGRHIPGNPTIVPKNMEGAGSIRLANWLYNVAPRDGTAFGTVSRGAPFDPLLGAPAAQFDAREFTWIGSANNEVSVCVAWHTTGIARFEDLLNKELVVGGSSTASDTDQFAKLLNALFGTKLRLATGYPGGNEINLAIERGEVGGRCGWSWSSVVATHKHWLEQNRIAVLIQTALTKHADLPDVPLIADLARTEQQRQIVQLIFARQVMGRPFMAPPGVPPERALVLREAFMRTMKDPHFLADADKAKLEITPVSGADIEKLVKEVYGTSKETAAEAAAMIR